MRRRTMRLASGRVWTGAILTLLLLHLGAPRAFAVGEIVPALGVTKPVDGDGDAKLSGNLALRGHLLPILMTEVGIGYRSEERFNDQLKIRQWPITASVYLAPPSSVVYAGAGAGWYHTTFDYQDALLEDETKQQFGVHLGGGLQIPLGSHAGVDFNGRYVMMQDQEAKLVPEKFDPDFWTTTLGLAIKF